FSEAEARHATAEAARREAEEARRDARERAVARRAEVQTLRRSVEISRAEQERLAASLAEVTRREREAGSERQGLEREIEGLDAQSTPRADRMAELQRQIDELVGEVRGLEDQERRLEGRRQALDSRRQALAETRGRRFLRSKGRRAVGLMSELIEIEAGMEKAVAAALGPLADAVVYEDQGAAVGDAVDATGTTIAISEELPGSFVLPGARTLLSAVRPDPRAAAAVTAVLRHVYIARDRQHALERHRKYPAASFVTLDGLLVGPALVRTAPVPGEDELAVRREEVSIDGELGRTRKRRADRTSLLEGLRKEHEGLERGLKHGDGLITVAAERMARVDAELAALRREREVLEERLAGIEEHVIQSAASLDRDAGDDAEDELPDLPPAAEPPVALRVEVESLRREQRRLDQTLAARREEAARVREEDPDHLAAEVERASTVREESEALLRQAQEGAATAASTREEVAALVARLRADDAEANRAWRAAAESLGSLRDEYEDQEQARREMERRIDEAERVLREGHGADPAEALASLGEEDSVATLQKRSDLVARRLALLGRVNLVAGDEYRELQERHDFLAREIADVRSAKRDLEEVVREVDRKMVEIFDGAFRDVAAEFETLFSQLFPGGEGKLTLTEPDDLLATGIDIEARPGRKRVKRLSLLSGGERALTALGFLFAIFRARPSPFYLLDEVEAALDDINLHRFLELIKGFAGTSQVILVTHQKRTMEAADVLYGVSMGRDGASRVIAQRVADAVPS
ncbi:MAG: AAA family ATPase, partial [Actinomycetota bacterium]|nr:AAA family ATPase [Actinomycetota bacterium]